jgi:hypothetical protein
VAKNATAVDVTEGRFAPLNAAGDGPDGDLGRGHIDEPSVSLEQTTTVPLNFFVELLATFQASMKGIIEEIRKPPHDPIKEAQMKRAKDTKEQAEKFFWESLSNRAKNCTHGREDMTSAIAWAQQSDGKIRGACQHCQTLFSPVREECVSQEVFDRYAQVRRIPTQRGSGVLYINS